MTNTRADADAMVAAADAAGVRLAVVSQHRFRGAPMAAQAVIEAGRIGDIRMIRVFGPNAGWDIPADHWNSDRAQVSPYMDWGAHACDIVRWLTGREAVLAFAQFASYTDVPPTDQSSMVHYTLDGGDQSILIDQLPGRRFIDSEDALHVVDQVEQVADDDRLTARTAIRAASSTRRACW